MRALCKIKARRYLRARELKSRAVAAPNQVHSLPQFSYRSVTYTFLNCQNTLLEELKCPICLELVSDPVQTSCGHLFCGKCITGTDTCPVDRKSFTSTPDPFNSRRLGDFKVQCPNSEKGCSWQGELREAEEHTSESCRYQTVVKCKNGCGREMERQYLKTHEATECLHRSFKCPHCPFNGTYSTVTTSHLTICESLRLPCVAGCKRTLTRKEMKDHLAKTCSEELVECPHKMAGCTSVVKRKNLKRHTSDKDHHLQALLNSHAAALQHLYYRSIPFGARQVISSIPLAYRPWLQNTPTCYPCPPWVIRMEGFQEKKEAGIFWFSDPVYSHFGGYKMCLSVDASVDASVLNNHVSVYIYLMRGDNDDNLKWPFKGTITVSLLNQLHDGQHCTRLTWSPDIDIPDDSSGRVTGRAMAEDGWRTPFIYHHDLSVPNCPYQFLRDNTLFFRVDCFEPKLD